jgi:hypothetical protein
VAAPGDGRAIWSNEVEDLVKGLRWRVVEKAEFLDGRLKRELCPTLASWGRSAKIGLWLVLVTGHYVAVAKRGRNSLFADSNNREPIPLRNAPHRRKRVSHVWRIEEGNNE